MSEENRRELEPRFYRAVGATGPQSEKAFPALARRREKNTEDKFADSQEIAKKVEKNYIPFLMLKISIPSLPSPCLHQK
mgnify:CR=1 FL=1